MIERKRSGGLYRLVGLTLGLLLTGTTTSRGQVPEAPTPNYSETTLPMQDMKAGVRPVYDSSGKKIIPENAAVMKRMAQHLAYRLVKSDYHDYDRGDPRDLKTMSKLIEDAQKWFLVQRHDVPLNARQVEFAAEFGKALDTELKFVLSQDSKPIVRINAARMLSLLARSPYPGIVDTLMAIIKDDKEIDAVKLYAYQGLHNILSQADNSGDHIIIEPAKRAEIANLLIKVVTTPHTNLPKDPREIAAISYVRREAIRALGACKESCIRTRPGEVLARPALPLARIAIGDTSFSPPLSNSERAEAVLGLLQMRPDRDLRLDVLTHAVNVGILHLIRTQGAEGGAAKGAATIPWKAFGARMGVAVGAWKVNADRAVASQNFKGTMLKMADPFAAVALELESKGLAARPIPGPLTDWANGYKDIPKPALLFKDDMTSTLWAE